MEDRTLELELPVEDSGALPLLNRSVFMLNRSSAARRRDRANSRRVL